MTGGIHCPPAMHFFLKFAIFEFLYFLSLKQISTKFQVFVIPSMRNPFIDLAFSFKFKHTDILKCDSVSVLVLS